MQTEALTSHERSSSALTWTSVLTETTIVRFAMGLVALHIVDDNYLQPEPGTSAGDHLASGLVPVAILVGLAALAPRLRDGVRAWLSMTLGALALFIGAPGTVPAPRRGEWMMVFQPDESGGLHLRAVRPR